LGLVEISVLFDFDLILGSMRFEFFMGFQFSLNEKKETTEKSSQEAN
jgi:hypothetical protein